MLIINNELVSQLLTMEDCIRVQAQAFRKIPTGGAIHSWTVCHHPFNFFFKSMTPYVVALVDMDAGVRVNAPLRGMAGADLEIGKRVTLAFEPINKEVTLPFFVAE